MTEVVLTVGGSDSGGGAGIQADIKTFSVLGLHGTCVITAITAQNTLGVQKVFGMEPECVLAQLESVADDFRIAFAKTGMLHSAKIVKTVAGVFRERGIPFVVDPVIEAEAGGRLLRSDALTALKEDLISQAAVVTPNIFEAEALTGVCVLDLESANEAAERILDMGAGAVVIKGGHLDCTDLLCSRHEVHRFPGTRIKGGNHGVGCTYSAALTSFLARGFPLREAAERAKDFAAKAIAHSSSAGRGVGPVNQAEQWLKDAL